LKNMTKIKTRSLFLLATFSFAAILGVAAYRVAAAATPVASVLLHGRGFGDEVKAGYDQESLATALGISVDELNSAYVTAGENAINQALEEGLITQEQADQLRERESAFPFHRSRHWLSESDIDFQALLADALGISVETLNEAYQQAHQVRLDQAVVDGRLTESEADLIRGRDALSSSDAFRTTMQAAFEAAVQQAVENGVITQSQANQILSSQFDGGFLNFQRGMPHPRLHGSYDGQMPEGRDFLEPDTTDSNGL
jgi:hypothetical protein